MNEQLLTHFVLQGGKWLSVEYLEPISFFEELGLDYEPQPGKWLVLTWDVHREEGDHPDSFVACTREEALDIAFWFSDDTPLLPGAGYE